MSAAGGKDAMPIGRRISDVVNAVHRMAAATEPALAELVKRAAETSVDRATVVVAGEAKRGKSSLVNALIGRSGLSPVAPSVATACPVVLTYAAPERASARLVDGREVTLDPEDLDRWITGAPPEPAAAVEVGVDAPLLSTFTIIDTPGIGGLIPAHTATAMGALSRATAVLFVCDPTAPLSRPELDFVAEVASSVDTVLVALTKVDVNPQWRTLLEQDRQLLAAAVPRLAGATIFPVSSRLAARGLACDDPDDAALLREESGIAAMESTLRTTIAPRARALGAANTLRVALSVCEELERRATTRTEASNADPHLLEAAESERQRLVELNRENAAWGSTVEHQLGLTRLDVLNEATRRLTDSRRRWDETLTTTRVDDEQQLASDVAAAIADIDAATHLVLVQRIRSVATTLLGELRPDAALAGSLERLGRRDDSRPTPELPVSAGVGSGLDVLGTMGAFSMGRVLAATALPGGAAGWLAATTALPVAVVTGAFTVLPLAAGIGMMGLAKRWRGQAARRGELRTWVRSSFDEASGDLRSGVERGIADAKFALVTAMRSAIGRRIDEVNATVAAHNEALKLDAAARHALRQEAQQRAKAAHELAGRVRRVLTELLDASARTPAVPTAVHAVAAGAQ